MKHLVLLGATEAHLHLLRHHTALARHGALPPRITLLAPSASPLHLPLLAGYVAGQYALAQCLIPVESLIAGTPLRGLFAAVRSLDAQASCLTLEDGSVLNYDWLSVALGPAQDRQRIEQLMPGARDHALFTHPVEQFAALWPRVVELAQTRGLRFAVIGGDARALSLALAVRQRLASASVTLITGGIPLFQGTAPGLRPRAEGLLRARRITLLVDSVARIQGDELLLGSGARLACDVPLLAQTDHPPGWLRDSALALDTEGFIAVDRCHRSTSHRNVFATGSIGARPTQPSGATLLANLGAVLSGQQPVATPPARPRPLLISAGPGLALASWGVFTAQGRWLAWLKDRLDRRW